MGAVAIRKAVKPPRAKAVEANQKAIDELALGSGTWRVKGLPGLYVRCRVQTKYSFCSAG